MSDKRCYEAVCRVTPEGDLEKMDYFEALVEEIEGFQGGFESMEQQEGLSGGHGSCHYYFALDERASVELEPRLVSFLVQCRLAGSVQVAKTEEIDWTKNFREFFRPTQISRKFWVCPKQSADDGEVADGVATTLIGMPIIIEPGMGFGTGYHETTQMCLECMEELLKGGESFLDLGSGSGILSIAASKLGSVRVVGVEYDAQAIINARENIGFNGLSDAIYLLEGTLDHLPNEKFNTIACNMLLNEFIPLFSLIRRFLIKDGRLILSGYLLEEEAIALVTAANAGFEMVSKREKGEWGASLLRPKD